MKPDAQAFDASRVHLQRERRSARNLQDVADIARLEAMLALSGDWFWETDVRHVFTEFLGDERADMARNRALGLQPWQVPAANMADAEWDRVRGIFERHEPLFELEVARHHPNGSLQWMSIRGQPFFSESGQFLGYRGVARDVTVQRETQREREQQMEFTRVLTQRVPGLVFQLHRSASGWFSFPFASAALHELFQVSPEQAREDASAVFSRILPEDFAVCRVALEGAVHHLTPWVQNYRVRLPNGELKWHAANASPFVEADGSVFWYGFASDITERMLAEEQLQRAHDQFRARTNLMEVTLGSLSQGVMMISVDGRVTYYNQRLLELLNMPDSLLARQPKLTQLIDWQFEQGHFAHGTTRQGLLEYCDFSDVAQPKFLAQYIRTGSDGRTLEVKTQELDSGGWVRTFTDVSDYYQSQQALQRSELHLRALFDAIPDRVWLKDPEGGFIMANPEAAHAFGLEVAELVGRTELDIHPAAGLMPDFLETDVKALHSHAPVIFEQALPLANGRGQGVFEVVKRAVFDHMGEPIGVLGMARDVTERKRAEAQIERLAFYDPLTGLCNRRLFHDRLEQAQAASTRSAQWAAVCFIDLDNFKDLNDTQGHDRGDMLLQQVGQRLQHSVREQDTVARLGGDEFVLLLEDLGADEAQAALYANSVGQKVRDALAAPYDLGRGPQHNTPSIGITLFRDHHERVEDILKRADLAMYQSKSAGRNTVRFFDPHMQDVVQRRSEMEHDLRAALAGDQFQLYSQAVVNADRQIRGFEALLRWHHPQRGMVSPAEFIPVAEQTGLILALGDWVLRTACKRLAAWAGDPATAAWTLAVNLSARQLRQPDFVPGLLDILKQTGANPACLLLELTESLLLHDVEDTIVKMNILAQQGIRFALDDFGTGYSSLSYLKRLPLTILKIDQSFVRDLLSDPNDAAIARTILQLAQSLDLNVVAEGVETEGQRQFLHIMGCQAFQGYLFGRPGPM
jgi:diguanylate cyclase (GGDEF)-like protein/PAS domain S-box-containing protein